LRTPTRRLPARRRGGGSGAAAAATRRAIRDEVLTSLIALKAMTSETTGAVIAAPTTSLPEDVGGVRNGD
jgi:GH15 family glucan-1,4-alpha-glucosidase